MSESLAFSGRPNPGRLFERIQSSLPRVALIGGSETDDYLFFGENLYLG